MKKLLFILCIIPLTAIAGWQSLLNENSIDAYWDPDTVITGDTTSTVLILINNKNKDNNDKEASVIAQAEIDCNKKILRYQSSKSFKNFMGQGLEIIEYATNKPTTWIKTPPGNYFEHVLISKICRIK